MSEEAPNAADSQITSNGHGQDDTAVLPSVVGMDSPGREPYGFGGTGALDASDLILDDDCAAAATSVPRNVITSGFAPNVRPNGAVADDDALAGGGADGMGPQASNGTLPAAGAGVRLNGGSTATAAGAVVQLDAVVLAATVSGLLEQMGAAPAADGDGELSQAGPAAFPDDDGDTQFAQNASDTDGHQQQGNAITANAANSAPTATPSSSDAAAVTATRAMALISAAAARLTATTDTASSTEPLPPGLADTAKGTGTGTDTPQSKVPLPTNPSAAAAGGGGGGGGATGDGGGGAGSHWATPGGSGGEEAGVEGTDMAGGAAAAEGAVAAGDGELAEGCRLIEELCRTGNGGALEAHGGPAACAGLLMGVAACGHVADADRFVIFSAVAQLAEGGRRGTAPRRGSPDVGEAATEVEGGAKVLVECLVRWGSDPNPATAPAAAAALRATVALSYAVAPLSALLRARLLTALAAVLARGSAAPALQRSAAGFLAGLSAHSALSRLMVAAGVPLLAARLASGRTRPLSVRQAACDMIANLALGSGSGGPGGLGGGGDRATQQVLVGAGAGPALVKMLSLRNIQALCHAADAISNLTLGQYLPAQNAVRDGVAPLAGLLVSSIGPNGQPLPLAVQVARALSNSCLGHTSNQDMAVKSGIMPLLASWLRSRQSPLVRSATLTATNLVLGNAEATAAAVSSGLLQPVLLLLMQTPPEALLAHPKAPSPAPTAASATASSSGPSSTADPTTTAAAAAVSVAVSSSSSSSPTASELFEKACGLLCCLTAAAPELRTQLLRQSGLAGLMVARLAGAATPAVVIAVCGVLNNLMSSADPESQIALARAGAVPHLVRLVLRTQHEGVLKRACHCLATLAMGNKPLQDALIALPPLPPPSPVAAAAPSTSSHTSSPAAEEEHQQPKKVTSTNGTTNSNKNNNGSTTAHANGGTTTASSSSSNGTNNGTNTNGNSTNGTNGNNTNGNNTNGTNGNNNNGNNTNGTNGNNNGNSTTKNKTANTVNGGHSSNGSSHATNGNSSNGKGRGKPQASGANKKKANGAGGAVAGDQGRQAESPEEQATRPQPPSVAERRLGGQQEDSAAGGGVGVGVGNGSSNGEDSDLVLRLAGLLRAAAAAGSGSKGGGIEGGSGGRRPVVGSVAVAAEAARLCAALSFRSNAAAQRRLADAGVLEPLVALLRLNSVPVVCQALMAVTNLAGGCPANRQRFLSAGLAAELHRLLRVRGDEVVARAAYCVAVVADPGPTTNQPAAATAAAGTAAGAVGARTGANGSSNLVAANGGTKTKTGPPTGGFDGTIGGGGIEQDPRTALAAVGLVPPLVRGLRHNNTDVVARSVAALEALVRGHRGNALLVASAGGITHLAALLDKAAEQQTQPHAAGANGAANGAIQSGGASGGGSAAAGTASSTGELLTNPAAAAVAAAAAAAPSAAVAAANQAQMVALWRRCVELWVALGGPAALVRLLGHKAPVVVDRAASLVREIAEGDDIETQTRLLRMASVAPPLLRACRHRQLPVCEAAVRAVEALARCPAAVETSNGAGGACSNSFRAQLVDAGALGVLQGLQGHKRAAIARLAFQVAQALYVKPGGTAAGRM